MTRIQPDGLGNSRASGSSAAKLSGDRFQVRLGRAALEPGVRQSVDAQLHNVNGLRFTVRPGVPVRVLEFADANGEQVTVLFELRPKPDFQGMPASQIFLREVDDRPEEGWLALAWNDVTSVGGYELVLGNPWSIGANDLTGPGHTLGLASNRGSH